MPRAYRGGKRDANPPLRGGDVAGIYPDADTGTSASSCPSPALLYPGSPSCCMGTSGTFRAAGTFILHSWGFITTKIGLFTPSGSL